VGDCAAVGNYDDSSGHAQGLLLNESSGRWAPGVWGTGVEAALPANAGSNPKVHLNSVSCTSAGNCAAVGTYVDSSGDRQGLLPSESAGRWGTGVEATPPANAGSNPVVLLTSVSCRSDGNCAAVGGFTDRSHHLQGLLLSESSEMWGPGVEAALPANAGSDPFVILNSVSCTSAGNCAAVSNYRDSSGHTEGLLLLLTESSGAWGTGVEAVAPANASPSDPGVVLNSVSCTSDGGCAAAGRYFDRTTPQQQGVLLSESLGTWSTGVEVMLPANAGLKPFVILDSISCASIGNCAAVGGYSDSSGFERGLLVDAAQRFLSCSPSTVLVGSHATCTVTVFGSPPATGSVEFSATRGAGSFSPSSSCVLSGSPGACQVTFTPSASGSVTVFASYGGDGTYPAQSDGFTLVITDPVSKRVGATRRHPSNRRTPMSPRH
jgi:hypothetical protein